MSLASLYSRRRLLGVFAVVSGAVLAGCDRKPSASKSAGEDARTGSLEAPGSDKTMLVYRDPACGCCEAWADIARKSGYAVTIEDRADMAAVKTRAGVPDELVSCHTVLVGGYAVEGHVPMRYVAMLLRDRPSGIRGIAVPGMPRGSPGMEIPDGSMDAFEVMAFDGAGRISVFHA